MMTWMTRMSFLETAADLDTDLLVQVVSEGTELFQSMVFGIYENLDPNDPVQKGWYGYEIALAAYVVAAEAELISRGVSSHAHLEIAQTIREIKQGGDDAVFDKPAWVEDPDVLRSHRSNLARRWPKSYGDSWKGTPANMPYIWPFVDEQGGYRLMLSKADKALLASGERSLPTTIKKRIENL